MYNVLKEIHDYLISNDKVLFRTDDVIKNINLSRQSITGNISRLVKSGFLIKQEFRNPQIKGKFVFYVLSDKAKEILKELYK